MSIEVFNIKYRQLWYGGTIMGRNIVMLLRTWIRFAFLIFMGLFITICLVVAFYKPIYEVTINGEIIGYSEDKSVLQSRINEYMEKRKWR